MARPTVIVLHDNEEWLPPFQRAFEAEGVALEPWHLGERAIDLDGVAPEAVVWSRLSASAHTRGVPHAFDTASAILSWAEAQGRRVVNGSRVASLEVSKVRQHALLRAAGLDAPRTIAATSDAALAAAARQIGSPFITKHNRGGKGLGVRRFDSPEELDAALAAGELERPIDGIALVQELLVARDASITRAEFVGGRFRYAVRVDTSQGFELCPADACRVPGQDDAEPAPLFSLRPEITAAHPLVRELEALLAREGVEIAGVEFLETVDGRTVPYDINTNTNYSPDVEAELGDRGAAAAVARFLGDLARDRSARRAA
ncbi:alpha-L-glutamate ligase [Agrococcus sp. SL85]|uniref:ATP-grasp domain-containing protein n=1 Tax=Agrococcus sp. SL85 TaxID=2995141 RepID=UPI00226CEF06|nr:alpha-L-glutamate ligase [Agrococcus sp. SL85]WAC66618.1 alpha-L-glutamate ligase [Agrococcus sp. SL85]